MSARKKKLRKKTVIQTDISLGKSAVMRRIRWHVSPFLIIMAVALIICGYFYDCVIYFTTIVLHELSHAEVSIRLGYTLDRFMLMPYGASLKGDFEGVSVKDEILIAFAGPLFNCAVAVICTALWWLVPSIYVFTDRLVAANIFTALFNLLPVFPLDGGRIAVASLSKFMPRQRAYKIIRIFGFVLAPMLTGIFAALIILKKTVNISFAIMSAFIFISTVVPDKNSTYRRVYGMAYMSERMKRGLKVVKIMVPCNSTLIGLNRMLNTNYFTEFLVMDDNMKKIGEINEMQLEDLLKAHAPLSKVGDMIKSP